MQLTTTSNSLPRDVILPLPSELGAQRASSETDAAVVPEVADEACCGETLPESPGESVPAEGSRVVIVLK